jgi:ketosteroid isomerase-like protein
LDATAAREGEHKGLSAANDLRMQADDLDIQVFGNAGISTFILSYSFKVGDDRIQKRAHATLVFVKDQGSWKIVHEHLSPVTNAP